ncbi:MAG: VWA domain-containing protein [Planctomycetaceae bacterium]|nr:VWA domain-containing protein [Planctomycetaceae bacterium]
MSNPIYQNPIKVPHKVTVPVNKKQQDKKILYILTATILIFLLLLLLLFLSCVPLDSGNSGHSERSNLSGNGTAATLGSSNNDGTTGSDINSNSTTNDNPTTNPNDNDTESENGTDKETTSPDAPQGEKNIFASKESNDKKYSHDSQEAATETKSIEPDKTTTGEKLATMLNDQPNMANSTNFSLEQQDATLSIFGTTGKGSSFVFVFDRSGSMLGKPLYSAKWELTQALKSLTNRHRFNVIFYDNDKLIWQNNMVSANPKNKNSAVAFIENISAGGGTKPLLPLLNAISYRPDVIFFLTDGAFNLNLDEVCKKTGKTKINVIQFGTGSSQSLLLQDLAERTKGDYRYIDVSELDKL